MTVPLPADSDNSWSDWAQWIHDRAVDGMGTSAATPDTVVRRSAVDAQSNFGYVSLGNAPIGPDHAARKDYVDGQVATKAAATHAHTAADISDSTATGRSVLTAADSAAARTAIGAGTSNLAIGTTSTTAKAGDYSPPADAAAGVASMRTLGTGATQAAAGNHTHTSAVPVSKTTITGNYTLVAGDAIDKMLHSTAAAAVTITLPQDSAASIGQEIAIPWRQYGAGQITFAAGAGATILSRGSVFKSAGQYAEGLITKVAANTWLASGDLTA